MLAKLVRFLTRTTLFDSIGILSRMKLYQSSTELITASSTCCLISQSNSMLLLIKAPLNNFKHLQISRIRSILYGVDIDRIKSVSKNSKLYSLSKNRL